MEQFCKVFAAIACVVGLLAGLIGALIGGRIWFLVAGVCLAGQAGCVRKLEKIDKKYAKILGWQLTD